MPPYKIQYGAIDLRPLGLHPVEHEGWRILRGRIALVPVMGSKPSATSAICPGFGRCCQMQLTGCKNARTVLLALTG